MFFSFYGIGNREDSGLCEERDGAADARGGAAGVPGDGFLVGFPACEEQEDAKVFR